VSQDPSTKIKVRCPECLAPIYLKREVELWDPVTCPECHTALEVVNLRPLQLDYMEGYDDGDWGDGNWDDEPA
jgi:lysine biosynthesis protein LysW